MRIGNSLLLGLILVIFACDNGQWKTTEIIAVEKYHATRVWVIYKDRDGKCRKESLFQSDTVNCFGTVVCAEEYLSGRKGYGSVAGQEKEYQKYLQQKK